MAVLYLTSGVAAPAINDNSNSTASAPVTPPTRYNVPQTSPGSSPRVPPASGFFHGQADGGPQSHSTWADRNPAGERTRVQFRRADGDSVTVSTVKTDADFLLSPRPSGRVTVQIRPRD